MADESDEDVVEDQDGLSKVDDADLPEQTPRPEKPGDDADELPEDVEELVPEESDLSDSIDDQDAEESQADDADDPDSDEPRTDDQAPETLPGLSKVESNLGDDPDADDEESSSGLRKVEPRDVDEDTHSKQPNTRGPDSAGEMGPDRNLPFDPDAGPGTGLGPNLSGAGEEGPPPGHAAGATPPGELIEDDESAAESEPGAELEPETAPAAVDQVEPPPAEPDVETASPGDAAEELGDAPIAEPDYDAPDYEEEWDTTPTQPPDDEEMPLADHVEEMVQRFGVVLLTLAVGTAVSFLAAEFVLMAMWYGLVPIDSSPHVYGPLEKVLAEIKVASLGGVMVAIPVLIYESYLFMRPGLYPKERRYYLAAVPTSVVLGGIGMLFSYFLVLPVLFEYFIYYSKDGVDRLAFGLQVTFDLIVTMLWAFALVFQIPLLIMLAIMMGVTSREWLESKRLYFWGAFIGIGFFLGGIDPTSVAGMIIAATMIGLFEGTLTVLRWAQGDLPWRNRGASS
jgi:sec-independent protein translocase protein TatC